MLIDLTMCKDIIYFSYSTKEGKENVGNWGKVLFSTKIELVLNQLSCFKLRC